MRAVAWSFGGGPTFPGFTDDTYWNGFLNVRVTPATWPYVLAELIAGADGDADLIEQYRQALEVDGLVSLTHSLTTTEVAPRWAGFFPDYPVATMVPIPESWTDESWRHETAPASVLAPEARCWRSSAAACSSETGSGMSSTRGTQAAHATVASRQTDD